MAKVSHKQINLNYPGCSLRRTANQSIADNNLNAISWDTEFYDTDAMHDLVTNPTRITVPQAGLYLISGKIRIDATTPTYYEIAIYKNGSVIGNHTSKDYKVATSRQFALGAVVRLAANDYIEIFGRCSGGSARNFIGYYCFVQVSKLGE